MNLKNEKKIYSPLTNGLCGLGQLLVQQLSADHGPPRLAGCEGLASAFSYRMLMWHGYTGLLFSLVYD